ncbi:MAG: penicillin-binding protein 2 [Acidobacteria bacterium]|nr:penicillin-binding protein 2 [Acidobacteriota bacterium]
MSSADWEPRFSDNRLGILQWATVLVFLLLLSGFWRLQVLRPEYYNRLAEQNFLKNLPIAAPRGRILDRNGRVLVDNFPSFSVIGQWDYRDELVQHLPAIAKGFGMDPQLLRSRVESAEVRSPYAPIVLRENATREDIAFLESHRREFPELDLISVPRRLYLPEGFAAHLLGYVGEVSEGDLDRPQWALLRPGALVGKSGLERQYDDILRGQDGARRVVVDNLGREAAVLDEQLPTPGADLHLTLDADLQAIAEGGFQGEQGALVALDPRTGAVLALVSRPSFDPNQFATGISREQWAGLVQDPSHPLLNRAIQAQLAPGSIYKVLTTAASLEAGTLDASATYYCPGSANFYGRNFKCWQTRGHGRLGVHQALVQSCDVFFYNVGKELGIDRIAEYSSHFGLGRKTGIDLPNEEGGTLPSPEWKEKMFREKWYAGETISVAIGQGALTVTPLQVAYSVGGIASGGNFARPHLVIPNRTEASNNGTPHVEMVKFPLSEDTVAIVTDAMYGVVNEGGGTGARARVVGLDIGGKTGTAQVASNQLVRGGGSEADLRDNAWFVGLAPRRNPEIVVAVLYQSGEHGYLAAPLARDVIKAYFDIKQGIEIRPRITQQAETPPRVAMTPAQDPSGG